ncbi:Ulp1 protease family, catalytic domain protein [Dictyocaulus viviparus]|uniref:Ulp1 protease family, catalytic domain protein n=1 Tax=Dictyocaulus viviparus TaxID=29172 RepID=A0A0D8X837_DICVI|nr:Ulp1 protease family, catalytic domain protein [Dictyocaulus viviparus]
MKRKDESESMPVDENEFLSVDENEFVSVDENESMPLNENEFVSVDGNEFVQVDENEFVPVDENEFVQVDENEFVQVDENESMPVGESESLHVGGSVSMPVATSSMTDAARNHTKSDVPLVVDALNETSTTSSSYENAQSFKYHKFDEGNKLQLNAKGVMIGDTYFNLFCDLLITKERIRFSVLRKIDGETAIVVAYIKIKNVVDALYNDGDENKFLGLVLDDDGQKGLPSQLQVYSSTKYWHLMFHLLVGGNVEEDVKSKLEGFFESKIKIEQRKCSKDRKDQNVAAPSSAVENDSSTDAEGVFVVPEQNGNNEIPTEKIHCILFANNVKVSLFPLRRCLKARTCMRESFANFCMVHYIPNVVHSAEYMSKNRFCLLGTEAYEFIRYRHESRSVKRMKLDKENGAMLFSYSKTSVKLPPFLQSFIQFDVTFIPIFWRNHWMLAIFQWLSRNQSMATGRLILCDSTVGYLQDKESYKTTTEIIHKHIGSAINAALLMAGRQNTLSYLSLIRCENLPCQHNSTDCGWFMVMYAELFTKFISWRNSSTDAESVFVVPERKENNEISKLKIDCILFANSVKVHICTLRECLKENTCMHDSLANFCMVHYIPNVVHSAEYMSQQSMKLLGTEAYEFIKYRCESASAKRMKLDKENVAMLFSYSKKSVNLPPFLQSLIQFDVTFMPIFWRNHWMLAIFQWLSRDESMATGRLILCDSNEGYTQNSVDKVCFMLPFVEWSSKCFSFIRCENLPCQPNSTDCGWFMNFKDDEIRRMLLGARSLSHFNQRLMVIKREIGDYLESVVNRSLNIQYGEV